jgi:hypothetical protein
MSYLYLPFILQSLFMAIDEELHKKRGLGLWERLGHPLDTLTVFVPLSFVAIREVTETNMTVFIILAVFSCLFITKDEFIHAKECSAFENWLHSVLFILHPMIFLSTAVLWKYHPANEFLTYQPLMVGAFMTYQILKWSIPWKDLSK